MIFTQRVSRPTPAGPSHLFKTYGFRSPIATHHRKATCAEIECPAYVNGWTLRIEHLSEHEKHAAKNSGRHWNLVRVAEGETYMAFAAGQPCFAAHTHTLPLDRPAIFIVGRGDWRTFVPRQAQVHKRAEDWVDDMQTHFDGLRRDIERG